MQSISGIIYLLLFFSYILVGLFIIFHILRYSLRRSAALFGAVLFSVVFLVLLLTNFANFAALSFNTLIPRSF